MYLAKLEYLELELPAYNSPDSPANKSTERFAQYPAVREAIRAADRLAQRPTECASDIATIIAAELPAYNSPDSPAVI